MSSVHAFLSLLVLAQTILLGSLCFILSVSHAFAQIVILLPLNCTLHMAMYLFVSSQKIVYLLDLKFHFHDSF